METPKLTLDIGDVVVCDRSVIKITRVTAARAYAAVKYASGNEYEICLKREGYMRAEDYGKQEVPSFAQVGERAVWRTPQPGQVESINSENDRIRRRNAARSYVNKIDWYNCSLEKLEAVVAIIKAT